MYFIGRFGNLAFRHRHKWETTHTNPYLIPTVQVCKCGLSREADTKKTSEPLKYVWVYSDGKISKPYSLGDGLND